LTFKCEESSLQFDSGFDNCSSSFEDCTQLISWEDRITAFDVEGIHVAALILETIESFFFNWWFTTWFDIIGLKSLRGLVGLVMEILGFLIVL